MGVVSSHGKASYGEGWEQVPDHASSRGGKMAKLARTLGNVAAKDESDYARGHNLESVMDVGVPLDISKKEKKYHMKKVAYVILEQQWKET
jgi:hypothetical protein